MKKRPLVILDAGHGIDTAGKCSPIWGDGKQLFEYEFNRDVVARIATKLDNDDIGYVILVPEENDISLSERCRRANQIYQANGKNAYLISVHANAGGGTGWECFTSVGETRSDAIAGILCEEATQAFVGKRMRFDHTDGNPDKECQFYMLRKTQCPAVLTENFFMDTESDCRYIMSEDGRDAVAEMHSNAIRQVIGL